jgi:putative Mg2+ transporter-C (MgtC) family protein
MPLSLSWEQIGLRLGLACAFGFLVGLNRDQQGHPAGIRTTMLVCLAAALAMLQVNLLLPLAGKSPDSFIVMDLMRLPLGILSGIGFIGAGVIIKRGADVTGVTTAASMWVVTVLGLLFGAGNIYLGITGSIIVLFVLWLLKFVEGHFSREHHGSLCLTLCEGAPSENALRQLLSTGRLTITHWSARYDPPNLLANVECELKWYARGAQASEMPTSISEIRSVPGLISFVWKE